MPCGVTFRNANLRHNARPGNSTPDRGGQLNGGGDGGGPGYCPALPRSRCRRTELDDRYCRLRETGAGDSTRKQCRRRALAGWCQAGRGRVEARRKINGRGGPAMPCRMTFAAASPRHTARCGGTCCRTGRGAGEDRAPCGVLIRDSVPVTRLEVVPEPGPRRCGGTEDERFRA